MTPPRTTIPDALLKRALVERASGPRVDLLPGILVAVGTSRQRRGWAVDLERSRRPLAVGLIAAAVTIALAGAVLVGAGIWQPRPVDGPFRGNGPIVVSTGSVVAVDPTTGAVVDRMPLAGSNMFGSLAWSPRGDRLAASDAGAVSVYDARTRTTRTITSCAYCSVSWTPDGARLAVGRSGEIALVDPADGRTIDTVPAPGIDVLASSWEPAGDRIAFAGRAADGVHLYVVDRDGTNLRSLDGPIADFGFGDVGWSPASGTIAYLRFDLRVAGTPADTTPYDLQVMHVDPDGRTPPTRIVTAGQCFCVGFSPGLGWSPDGRQLAVTSLGASMDAGLYLVDADGSGFHRIVDGASGTPAWRPVP